MRCRVGTSNFPFIKLLAGSCIRLLTSAEWLRAGDVGGIRPLTSWPSWPIVATIPRPAYLLQLVILLYRCTVGT